MLDKEMDAFEEIVRQAENLNGREKDETVREVERRCGILVYASRVAWAKACRDRLDAAELR